MFAKLLKHEWKASRGILGVLSLAALGVGVLGTIVLRVLISNMEALENEETAIWLPIVLMFVLMFLIFALFAYVLGSELLLLYRFYKSKFTDEGYLTFTLPVTSKQIFLAAFLNMAIWMAIIALVVSTAMGVMILVGAAEAFDPWVMQEMGSAFEEMMVEPGFLWINILYTVIAYIYGLVMMMTCVVVGAVIAKKHKVLAAFGIYYGVSMAFGIINTIVVSVFTVSSVVAETDFSMVGMYLCEMGIQLVLILGGFFLSTYLMEKKLNLP